MQRLNLQSMRSMGVASSKKSAAELILNGDFANGLTSWTYDANVAVVGGELILGPAGTVFATQYITTEVGKNYRATCMARKIGGDLYLQVGTTLRGFDLGYSLTSSLTMVSVTVDFTATTASTCIALGSTSAGVDNVSVKLR